MKYCNFYALITISLHTNFLVSYKIIYNTLTKTAKAIILDKIRNNNQIL